MIIPNKFNGYSADNRRLYNDPATLALTASAAAPAAATAGALGTAGAIGAGTAGALGAGGLGTLAAGVSPAVAGIGALEGGLALGALAGEGALGLGALAAGVSPAVAGIGGATAASALPAMAAAAPEIAAAASPLAALPVSPAATGLQSLAQTAGFTPWQSVASAAPQIAPEVASMITPTTGIAQLGVEAPLAAGAQSVANSPVWGAQGALESGAVQPQSWWEATKNLATNPSWDNMKQYAKDYPLQTASGLNTIYSLMKPEEKQRKPEMYLRPYESTRQVNPQAVPTGSTAERQWFTGGLEARPIQRLAVGGPVETMSAMNAVGDNAMYPQSQFQTADYSNPMVQRPMPSNVIKSGVDVGVVPYSGESRMADGGLAGLGAYSDGGRLLKGPGDGVSDSIPAQIGKHQPARLANNEFVVPARIVSEIGNGSTDAGARKLYQMMDRIQQRRSKTVGKGKIAVDSGAHKEVDRL